MRKFFISGLAAMAVATFSLVSFVPASAEGDCGSGAHASRTASTSIDTTATTPQTPVAQPKSGG